MLRGEEAWSKLSGRGLDVYKRYRHSNLLFRMQFDILIRDQILFEVASELEFSVISLSSTAEGYRERINSMKEDISQLERWDGDDENFEDSQVVIQVLRRRCIPRNGKGRLT